MNVKNEFYTPKTPMLAVKYSSIGPKLGSQQDTPKIPTGYTGYGENTYSTVAVNVKNELPTPKNPIFAIK